MMGDWLGRTVYYTLENNDVSLQLLKWTLLINLVIKKQLKIDFLTLHD